MDLANAVPSHAMQAYGRVDIQELQSVLNSILDDDDSVDDIIVKGQTLEVFFLLECYAAPTFRHSQSVSSSGANQSTTAYRSRNVGSLLLINAA